MGVPISINKLLKLTVMLLSLALFCVTASARTIKYGEGSGEIEIYVRPGEPTQVEFPAEISGGYKSKHSSIVLDKKGNALIVFPNRSITEDGEAFIVRLVDGRSYPIRARRVTGDRKRDDIVKISDSRGSIVLRSDEEEPPFAEKKFEYAPATTVSGFMRELVLVTEFGKAGIAGYKRSTKYKGQVVFDDGTLSAVVDSIYIGPDLWGYVLDAENKLNQTQILNPATFRLDGTRAISASSWELAPVPLTTEQKIANKHKAKVYIITKAR